MTEKSKTGAGKFFLGALLGMAAGAVAGKFIKDKMWDENVGQGSKDPLRTGL